MPEDLRLPGKRDRVPTLVAIVVAVPGEDVEVGAAQPDRRDTHQDFTGPGIRAPDIPYLDPTDVNQNGRFHGRLVEVVEVGGGWWRFKPSEPPETPPTCSSTTDAIVLGGTRGSWIAKPESARSIVSGVPSASSAADSGRSETPVSASRPSLGQSNTWAYSLPRLAV